MTTLLANHTVSVVCPGRPICSEENRTPRPSVKMMCSLRTPALRFQSFSGLRPTNSLDLMAGPAPDFFAKVNLSVSSRKGRASRCVAKAMFERFTEKAIKVIVLTQEEARSLGHNFVGTEQLLLGLIGEETGIAAKVLKSTGINLKVARAEVEKIIGRGSGSVPAEIPFTPRVKRVLELSLDEARQLRHSTIGTEHLLLGLLRDGEGVAARVLENLGVDASNLRKQVIRMVTENVSVGSSGNSKMPTSEEYWTILSKLAEEGKLDPLIKRVVLDMGLLVAGTNYRGEFEERLKKLVEEIRVREEIIQFVDEVHTQLGEEATAEGAIDAVNILKRQFRKPGGKVFFLLLGRWLWVQHGGFGLW